MHSPAWKSLIVAIACTAYSLIVIWLCEPSLGNDAGQYLLYAKNLWREGVYGITPGVWDAHREPGYPFFLALIGAAPILARIADASLLSFLLFGQSFIFALACWLFLRHAIAIPSKLRQVCVILLFSSPTVLSAHGVLYSESLSLTLSVLLLTCLGRIDFSRRVLICIFACLVLSALTKSYWARLWLFAPLLLLFRRDALAKRLVVAVGGGSVAALITWSLYSSSIASGAEARSREFMNLAGKIRRTNSVNYITEWKPAMASVLGSNFCEQNFGAEVCEKHDFRGSDREGIKFLHEISSRSESPSVLLLKEWIGSAPKQLLASSLEFLRMSLFEFTDIGRFSDSELARKFPPVWHTFGSVLLLLAVFTGVRKISYSHFWTTVPLFVIVFHVAVYVNVSVVARFVLPVLPFLYLFAANGFMIWANKICVYKDSGRQDERF